MAYDDSAIQAALQKKTQPNSALEALRQKIQAPVNSDAQGNQFRFDPAYAERLRQLQGQFAGYDSQEELGTRRIGEDYAMANRNLSDTNTDTLKRLQEKLANQGIGRSGINVQAQGDIGQAYEKDQGALGLSTSRSLEDLQRALTSGRQGIVDEKNQLDTNRTRGETDYRIEQERIKAESEANRIALEQQQQQFEQLKAKILESQQPQPTPTGQMRMPQPVAIPQAPPPVAQPQPVAPPSVDPQQQIMQQLQTEFNSPMKIRALQSYLKSQGFDPGAIDGSLGPRTMAAYMAHKAKLESGMGSSSPVGGAFKGTTARSSML